MLTNQQPYMESYHTIKLELFLYTKHVFIIKVNHEYENRQLILTPNHLTIVQGHH